MKQVLENARLQYNAIMRRFENDESFDADQKKAAMATLVSKPLRDHDISTMEFTHYRQSVGDW